ncbi:peptidyl-prolyl cis-trans isomerase-like 1 [Sesbania bispinosa]|nr:peptidyl-prolyl cis-trans isomerase-like 1 [Sesbania bispinosa]
MDQEFLTSSPVTLSGPLEGGGGNVNVVHSGTTDERLQTLRGSQSCQEFRPMLPQRLSQQYHFLLHIKDFLIQGDNPTATGTKEINDNKRR